MITRSKARVFKPKSYLAITQDLEQEFVKAALANSKLKDAMQAEFNTLQKNNTRVLIL